jgi:hypothetical protein
VYVFGILAAEVSYCIVAYGADKGVGVGGTTAEKTSGQMIDEVTDRYEMYLKNRMGPRGLD